MRIEDAEMSIRARVILRSSFFPGASRVYYERHEVRYLIITLLTLLRADDPEIQVQVGVGAQFPVYRRLSMAIDLRGNGGGSTMIVRPTAAIIYYFR